MKIQSSKIKAMLMSTALTLLFLILNSHSFAQFYSYSLQLTSGSSFCPMPAQVILKINGYGFVGNNILCSDSAKALIEWGDGAFDTIPLNFTGNNTYCYFIEHDTHAYEIPGVYQIKATLIHPAINNNIAYTNSFEISSDCSEIDGLVFEDSNANCIHETTEQLMRYAGMTFFNQSGTVIGMGFSDSTGHYSAKIASGWNNCYYQTTTNGLTSPCGQQAIFSTNNDTTINIDMICSEVLDVKVCHGGTRVRSPGQWGFGHMLVYAKSCFSNSSQVLLEFPDDLNWLGMMEGPEPDSINGNLYYWNINFDKTPMTGFGNRVLSCMFEFKTKTTASIGDTVIFKAFAFSDSSEKVLSNNNHSWKQLVSAPYDPNNKLVTPQGNGPYGKVAPETEFTYTVNFQNTGNDTAINVFVIDTLSEHLDLESIEILDSKHPMTVAYYNDRVLRFDFKNIQLPDSGASQEGSKGWFVFSVKAKENLALGTEIRNYVDIYFDYNAPIRTNSTINTIDQGITHPKLDLIAQNNLCFNNDIGAISAQVSGGTEPYNFLWNPKLEGASNDSLTSGIYSVTVIDSNLFMDYNTIEIVDNRTITANPGQISGNYEVTGGDYHSYEVVENPSSSFDWTVVGGTITQENGHRVKVLWADTMTGSIKVVQTDSNGCIGSTEQSILVYPLSISEAEASSFSIYPNPTDGIIEIQLNELSGSDRMEILDIQGRVVYTKNLNNTSTQIDLSALASGTYTVRMIGDNVSEERTMVKR